ncbi:Ser/Thr protein phosphatase, putative [Trichomonas vaginalis G3]|uniref:Ser/Thr protein phosphatase, putative n=1 Tax=Trichomonas vaginalis (strain ATCC PRA-98 / G3) TaxID=412133 RepID=A2FND5_TRIV3|nr:helicase related family [Trichomonas vaginalis G3]EAX93571.1 Ser/Thr protein phosphatase, putative [Trichomonas vaginalis G3]KAI5540337.1 helicase related family [Trichomonas vaginalis G3]|eukprot:XP_001306501.1 Ser/Thr protein phosphatase [Trichomonas vaginalis G3]
MELTSQTQDELDTVKQTTDILIDDFENATIDSEKVVLIGCRYLMTKYLWLILFLSLSYLVIMTVPSQNIQRFSGSNNKFNSSEDPSLFIHMTDTHVSSSKQNNNINYNNALNFSKRYNHTAIVNSGDLVDDWTFPGKTSAYLGTRIAIQNENDYKLLRNFKENSKIDPKYFIEAAGNHDMFNTYSLDISSNLYMNSVGIFTNKTSSETDFIITTRIYENIAFLIVNPYDFPRSRALLDIFIHPSKKILDLIEAKIVETLRLNEKKQIIIVTHYPVGQWGERKSSNGLSFKEMIIKYHISVVLTGHSHPYEIQPQHHESSLEIICSDLVGHRNIGIVTNDNGNIFYHSYKIYDNPSFVVTYPIDYKQISKMSMFSSNHIDVRVIVFSDSENETLLCDRLKMKFERHLKPGMSLYHVEMFFNNGFQHVEVVHVNSSTKNIVNFFVGGLSPYMNEVIGDERQIYKYTLYLLILLFIIMLVVLIPFNIERRFSFLEKFYISCMEYIENKEKAHRILDHLKFILFGFLFIRFYLVKYNRKVLLYLFLLLVSPIIIPIGVTDVEGNYGVFGIHGTIIKWKSYPTQFTYVFFLLHIGVVTIPYTFVSMMLCKPRRFNIMFIVDVLFALFCIAFTVYFSIYSISHATTLALAITNFLFVLVPFVFVVFVTNK